MKAVNLISLLIFVCFTCVYGAVFPKEFLLKFELEGVGSVKLSLTKQGSLDDESLLGVTTDQDSWNPKLTQKKENYEDVNNQAMFSVTYVQENRKPIRKYFGSFLHENKAYSLKPADENVISEAISSYNVNLDGVDYVVSETKNEIQTQNKAELKTSATEDSSSNFVNRVKRQSGLRESKKKVRPKNCKRKVKKEVTKLIIELHVVVDYSIYKEWFKYMKSERYKARFKIFQYYSHVIDGVNEMYSSIVSTKYSIQVQMTGLYIIENPEDSPTELPNLKNGNDLNYNGSIEAVTKWLTNKRTKISHYDILGVFTKYRSTKDYGSMSMYPAACDPRSLFIALDNGVYGTVEMAAYGIGSCLGAMEDGIKNGCEVNDQHGMAATFVNSDEGESGTFSSCSINYFEKYVDSLTDEQNCLLSTKVERKINTKQAKILMGAYSVDDQCRQNLGPESYFCSLGIESDEGKCAWMGCYEYRVNACWKTAGSRAYEGTPCGDFKFCKNKKCVYDTRGPSLKIKTCLHGDSIYPIEINKKNRSCKDIFHLKKLCVNPVIKESCCEMCRNN